MKRKIMTLLFSVLLILPFSLNIAYAKGEQKALDPKAEPNYVTIISKNDKGEEVLGFKYQLINNKTKEVINIDLTKKGYEKIELSNEKATYTLKNTQKPSNYKDEKDIEFELPKLMEDGKSYTKEIKINLKHIEELRKYTPTNFYVDNKIILIGALALIVFGSGLIYYKRLEK